MDTNKANPLVGNASSGEIQRQTVLAMELDSICCNSYKALAPLRKSSGQTNGGVQGELSTFLRRQAKFPQC
jgi:hypothetical protein